MLVIGAHSSFWRLSLFDLNWTSPLGSTGSTLVMDEIAACHQRQNGKRTPPPFFTPTPPTTAPGTPKISNKITPSPTVLQDLKGGNPKVTTKAGVTDTNSKSDPSHEEAKATIMTPSPLKKDDVSEMTVSPSKVTSPTKLNTTALEEDPALDAEDISTFINYDKDKTEKKTDDSDRSTDNSAESSKRDADNSDASSKDEDDSGASTKGASTKEDADKKEHAVGE